MSTVAQRLPSDRRFEFSSQACPGDTFAVVRMSGFEAISRPYRFELVLVSDDARIDLARVLAAKAELRILAPDNGGKATPYAGMLAEFDQLHQAGGFTFYRALLVPRLWQLSLYRNSEVYLHEQTIPEIVESLLKGAKLNPANDYALKLRGKYRPRSYVCQYQETPLAFISRWLEREGIYYYFEQAGGVDRLVLLDDRVAQPAAALAVNYRPADELDVGLAPDSVQGFVCRTRPLPRSLVLQDYNHRRASVPLMAQAEVSASGLGEEMLYGENFRSEEEGQRYATIRAEEMRCGGRVFSGEATAVGLRSGQFMALSHHYRDDFNGRFLVTEINHEGSQAGALLAGLKTPFNEREGQTSYSNSFVALPEATQYRPVRSTPKPRVAGTMSATVDAEGSGEYAELDEHGQYKVQIPFDRTEKGAAKGSAPVRMASPYAGSEHGMHFPLHKGTEVLLSFADGDPDQPVILGAVPNSATPNVVDQRNPHDNLISTKGGNQMLMSDTKGKEVIWMNSPFHDSSIGIGSVDPRGGGSIFSATKGGSDSVSFGVSNSMSFGSKNSLTLGAEASLSGAFANKVSWGAGVSVSASNSVDWKMNMVPMTKDITRNLSIDDSKSVKWSTEFEETGLVSASISAGALDTDALKKKVDARKALLRLLIGTYTTLNFAQSAAFGAAVNGNFDQRRAKGIKDEADAQLQDRKDAAQKVYDGDKTVQDAKAIRDKAKIDAERENKIDEKDTLEVRETKRSNLRWKLQAIDDAYDSATAAAEKTRASAVDAAEARQANASMREPLHGWGGVVGKFVLDAGLNTAFMATIQGLGRLLSTELDSLNDLGLVSHLDLDKAGIRLAVNDDRAPGGAGEIRCDILMDPQFGISLQARNKTGPAAEPGVLHADVGKANLQATSKMLLTAPDLSIGDTALKGGFKSKADQVLVFCDQTRIAAKPDKLSLTSATIEIGDQKIVDQTAVYRAKLTAAETQRDLATLAYEQYEQKCSNLSRQASLAGFNLDTSAMEPTRQALQKTCTDTAEEVRKAQDRLVDAVSTSQLGPLLHGFSVSSAEALLTFGTAAVKASNAALSLSQGNAKADFNAVGVSVQGNLIKLG